jgi:RNA polymerase sigma-70 factor (ECF subfamily)
MGRDEPGGPPPLADAAALGRMFEEHRPRLLAMLGRRLDPALAARVDAEDLVHETFLLARRRWDRFATSGMSPYAWLYRLALDCLIEAWRRETCAGRDPGRERPWPEQSSAQLGLSLVGTATSPSEALARGELQERMRRALEQLRPGDREILWMRHFDQLPFRDVAAVLGIAEDAAMRRYARALRRLKDLWAQLGDDQSRGT